MTINLDPLRRVLNEVDDLIELLDGQPLDEVEAVDSQSTGDARRVRAKRSQDLQLLATRLELGAQLVRVEYWRARGKGNPLGVKSGL